MHILKCCRKMCGQGAISAEPLHCDVSPARGLMLATEQTKPNTGNNQSKQKKDKKFRRFWKLQIISWLYVIPDYNLVSELILHTWDKQGLNTNKCSLGCLVFIGEDGERRKWQTEHLGLIFVCMSHLHSPQLFQRKLALLFQREVNKQAKALQEPSRNIS